MFKIIKKINLFPKTILIASLLITIFFMIQIKKNAQMETDLDKYMPQKHSAFVYSNKAEKWFNIKDGIIIAIENKDGIYNQGTITKIKQLTKKRMGMDAVSRLLGCKNLKTGSGTNAIKLAKQGKWKELRQYCSDDVDVTEELYLKIKQIHEV